MMRTLTAVCGIVLVTVVGLVQPARADVAPLPIYNLQFKGVASGKCLDVPDGRTYTSLQIWDCTGGINQRWDLIFNYPMKHNSNTCPGHNYSIVSPGAPAWTEVCGGTANYVRLNDLGEMVDSRTGLCLDVKDWGTTNGSPLQWWTCTGTPNQLWTYSVVA